MKTSTNEQLTTKIPGEAKEQEKADELSWKLSVIIVPLLAVLGVLVVFFICKRRRASKDDSKPNIEPAQTAQFENQAYLGNRDHRIIKPIDNPLYDFVEQEPRKRADDNEYSFADEPVQVELSEDDPEGYYEDIDALKAKDSTKDFGKNTFGFANLGFQ